MTVGRAAVVALVVALSASAPAPATALYPALFGLGAGAGLISGSGLISDRDIRGGSMLRDVRGRCVQGRQRLDGIVAWGKKKLTKEEEVRPAPPHPPTKPRSAISRCSQVQRFGSERWPSRRRVLNARGWRVAGGAGVCGEDQGVRIQRGPGAFTQRQLMARLCILPKRVRVDEIGSVSCVGAKVGAPSLHLVA